MVTMKTIENHNNRISSLGVLLLAMGGLFHSCQQGMDGEPLPQTDAPVPVEVQASITGNATTRASYDALGSGKSIGIFRLAQNDYTLMKDVKYTNTGGTWAAANTANKIYVGAQTAKLCAYHSTGTVNFEATGNGTVTTLTAQPYKADKDLWYATKTTADVWKKTPAANFNMDHAYSRITFTLIRQSTYLGDCKVTKVALAPASGTLWQTRKIDISSGTLTNATTAANLEWTSAAAGWTAIANGISAVGGAGNKDIDLLLPPQSFTAASLTVTLTIDGIAMSVAIPTGSGQTLNALDAGQQYGITLKLKGSSLKLDNVETQNWTDVSVGSGYETH